MQTLKLGRTGIVVAIAAACLLLAPAAAGAQSTAVTAVPVPAMPAIDGSASDDCWNQATATEVGPFVVKAVYTDAELGLLFTYQAPDLTSVTSEAVAAGRAVAGTSGLSDQALAQIGTAYRHLQASLPGLVPADPSGVRVGATSNRGTWTVELTRSLVTNGSGDLQFNDLGEAYVFTAGGIQGFLTFASGGPGLADGFEEEKQGGCFCRTTM